MEGGNGVEDGDVDPLEHRGEDERPQLRRRRVVLVGVDADGPHLGPRRRLVPGRLEDPDTGPAGHVEDDVGAGLVHTPGHLPGPGGIGEAAEVRRLGEIADVDGGAGVDPPGPGHEAGLEQGSARAAPPTPRCPRSTRGGGASLTPPPPGRPPPTPSPPSAPPAGEEPPAAPPVDLEPPDPPPQAPKPRRTATTHADHPRLGTP